MGVTMTDPSAIHEQQATLMPTKIWTSPEYDDDDEADYDDWDDETPVTLSPERWPARPDFGSPQWWSRT
jgi:hypothetical protein